MVVAPKKPCRAPGCPALTTARYCAAHANEGNRQVDARRPSAARRGYDRRWERIRRAKLERDPLCAECLRAGRGAVEAAEVDHIVPLARGGGHGEANLQSLCKPCHSAKTARETVSRRREG
jgi:5-methylcytosine-specific restriction protein A